MKGTARPRPLGRRKGTGRNLRETQEHLGMERSPPEMQIPITLLYLIYVMSTVISDLSDLGQLSLMCFQDNEIHESR